MPDRFRDYLKGILDAYDTICLDKEYHRRIAVKPLYDYYQSAVLEVAVHLCGSDRNSLKNYHLKTRWNIVKSYFKVIEDPDKWDTVIGELGNLRGRIEHTDYEIPTKTALSRIREPAVEFYDWILEIGRKYNKKVGRLSLIQNFSVISDLYLGKADWFLHIYGDQNPYSSREDMIIPGEEHSYRRLISLREILRSRVPKIQTIENLKKEDLDLLVELVKIIERLEAKENLLLRSNTCPKCGGKIVETRKEILAGNPEDPIPYAISYRVGCEKCDYELNEETIEV